MRDMEHAKPTATLDQSRNRMLRRDRTICTVRRFPADPCLIGLNRHPVATQRTGLVPARLVHGFPDPVRHKPGRLILYVQCPHELVAAEALLAGHQQVDGLHPIGQRDVAVLEHGPDRGMELLLAGIALERAEFGALAVQATDTARVAAVDAYRAIRPDDAFQLFDRGGFISEEREGEDGHGQHLSMAAI